MSILGGTRISNNSSFANITGGTITNTSISSGGHYISSRLYGGMRTGHTTGSIGTADTIYCCPFYTIDPINNLTQIAGSVTTARTSSNAKFGVATWSGTTDTMISTLNPTGVATTSVNVDVIGTFSAINLKGHQLYLLCYIGASTVMPVLAGVSNNSFGLWAVGSSSGNFTTSLGKDFTASGSTYSGGFASSFTLTPVTSAVVPI